MQFEYWVPMFIRVFLSYVLRQLGGVHRKLHNRKLHRKLHNQKLEAGTTAANFTGPILITE